MLTKFIAPCALAGLALAIAGGPAHAAPTLPTFILNPAGVGGPAGSQFGPADTLTGSAQATLSLNGASFSSFNETGFIEFTGATIGGPPPATVPTPGLGSTYKIYATFSFSGTGAFLDPIAPNIYAPVFAVTPTLTFDLWLDPTGNTPLTGTTVNTAGDVHLADGSFLSSGTNSAQITFNGNPRSLATGETTTATVSLRTLAHFNADPDAADFFVAPPLPFYLELAATFSNSADKVATRTASDQIVLDLTGGGITANVTFLPVPEPSTLSLLGMGMCAIGMAVRRRRQKA